MKLISEYGNEICHTDDERKIERLKRLGFREVKEENTKQTNNTVPKKKGATKNAKRKGESNTKTDI